MVDRPYYYRVRGRTLGPVGLRQIRQLAQRAQIGRTTDVSRDGTQWGKAGDFSEIFEVGKGFEPPPSPTTDAFDTQPVIDLEPEVLQPASSKWYYTVNGVQQGPVGLTTLQQMVAAGQLSANDYVFPEGGNDWLTVGSVPQLAGASFGGGQPVINVNVPRQAVQSESSNGLAIAGFVLSLVGFGPLGLILSLIALNSKNQANRGLAIAGAIIGGLMTLCVCGYVVFLIGVAANA
jgi:hypothetical protein